MNLVPVDTDPFAAPSPSLVPVDHDPFASPQQPDEPGFIANAARALRMGLPFGNQFVAGERTVAGMLPGYPAQSYGKNLEDVNAADARLQQEHPVIADLGQGTGAALGALAVPAAALGEGAQGLGLVGRATRSGLTGAGIGAVQGAGAPGSDIRDLPQTEEGAVGGLYAGGALGSAFPVLGAGVGKGYSALADALRGGPGPADLAALQGAKQAAYQNVKDIGAAYSPALFKSLTDKIASDAAKADIDPDLNPKATKIIANLQNRSAEAEKSGTPVTLGDLDKARQFVNDNLSGLPEPKQARFGALIKDNIDDFVNTAFPGDMVPAPAKATGTPSPGGQSSLPLGGAARPQVPSGPAPTPMLDFLRSAGGLKDEGGDLASMGFSNLKGVAAKGSSKIIDKENGVPMDEARRMAVESGYMEPHETVSDFINKLGEHPTYSVHDEEAVAARAARDAYDYGPSPENEGPPLAAGAPAPFELNQQEGISPSRTANPQEAAAAIRDARELAQRQFKANALADALKTAKVNASVSGTGGNIENTGRRTLASILEDEPWSPDEKAQLEKMVHGTPVTNTLRQFSRFGPKGNALMAALEVGAIGTGNPALMTAGGVGMAAQGAGALMRRNAQNKLMATILAGGKAPAQSAPPRMSRAAMAAALAANADLQAQRNQATPQ